MTIPAKFYIYSAAAVAILTLGAGIVRQHDARVRAEAVAAMYSARADSLRAEVDSAWAAKVAGDSAYEAQLDSLEAEITAGQEAIDSTVAELPPLRSNVDSLIAVLDEYVPDELRPVVDELRVAVGAERQTSADIFRQQQLQLGRLNAELGLVSQRLEDALDGWERERELRLTVEQQLGAVIDASKPDLLKDRLIPAALGAAAVLLIEKAVN